MKRRILLVEDNPGDAALIRGYILQNDPGADFVLVETIAAARAYLKQSAGVEVILLDLSLPDARGLETVKSILRAAPNIPVVVLTSLDDEDVAVQTVKAGAQDYLVKGKVGPEVLVRSIKYSIERNRLFRERENGLAAEQEARLAAEAAVAAREQILHVVSHELGNHLAAVRFNSSVLFRTAHREDQRKANAERAYAILAEVATMERLRADLLDIASIEAGHLSVTESRADPRLVVDRVITAVGGTALSRGVTLVADVDPLIESVHADADRLGQALGNLATNALRFAPGGSTITIRVRQQDGSTVFSVADVGPGVPKEDQERIFESYWKDGRSGGAGLGLSIVRGIAEAHGGRAWVDSETGSGATFYFEVPSD